MPDVTAFGALLFLALNSCALVAIMGAPAATGGKPLWRPFGLLQRLIAGLCRAPRQG